MAPRKKAVVKTRGAEHRSHDGILAAMMLAVTCVAAPLSGVRAQATEVLITAGTEISEDYETWSLFLICNPSWAKPDAYERIQSLWPEFTGFGRAIGDNHLAVWFWRQEPRWGTEELVEDLDVERAARYCDTYGLRPSRSPHVLVTTTYPTVDERVEEYIVLELAGAEPGEIGDFLGELADALFADDLSSLDPKSGGFWASLFEKIRGPIRRLGNDITITIESGPLQLRWSGGEH